MITDTLVIPNGDTRIVAASPSTNYRTEDLGISSDSGGTRTVAQFILPTSVNADAISSAELHLYPKTIVGLVTDIVLKTELLSGALDYRYVSWNNYGIALPWTTPGGDVISGTQTVPSAVPHNVSDRVIIDCTNAILYAYNVSKILTVHMLVSTETANANVVYYSVETANNGPRLVIKERQPNTATRVGKSTQMSSMPSM